MAKASGYRGQADVAVADLRGGPLTGVRVLELAGIGPSPFCAMVLADLGADVLRVERPGTAAPTDGRLLPSDYLLNRGRRSAMIDLKHGDGPATVLELVERADILIEGFRPGVCERLGVGPLPCLERNPGLVYGRMTGWGQTGPLAQQAGHDINYLAVSGLLHAIGSEGGPPVPPLNVVGDFGGGGMLLAFGIVCALLEARSSGRGQVVDAAMVDGAALLGTMLYGMRAIGEWSDRRGTNLLDGGAPFYGVYETADGRFVAVGALEAQFYAKLVETLGLSIEELPDQMDSGSWSGVRARFAEIFATRTREEWCERFEGVEACFAPVLSPEEAIDYPHNRARSVFVEHDGVIQPAPAPRFAATPGALGGSPPRPGEHTMAALADWGVGQDRLAYLKAAGAIE